MTFRKDFPIFKNIKDLVYLDSSGSSQQPKYVIDGVKNYIENYNSNVHSGDYKIAKYSQDLYANSKRIIANNLGVKNYLEEIIFTYNSTYASNLIISSLKNSKYLKKGDKVLITVAEHNANVIPWLQLVKEIGIKLEYVKINDNFEIDLNDFETKYDSKVKVIAFTHVSNVLGKIFALEEIGKRKRKDTLFIIDATQAIPHFGLEVKKLNCDFLYFTGYKVFAQGGIGVLRGKKEFLEKISSPFFGCSRGMNIDLATFTEPILPDKFELGTPNICGIVSLLKAFEYISNIGGYSKIIKYEEKLINYFLKRFQEYDFCKMIGSIDSNNRLGVFTFTIDGFSNEEIREELSKNNISVRIGKHCANLIYDYLGIDSGIRVSLHIYNTFDDIDKFFLVLKKFYYSNKK